LRWEFATNGLESWNRERGGVQRRDVGLAAV
jgi:hypothetical protein